MTQTQVSGSGIKNNVITNNHLHSAANIAGSKLADSGVTAGSYGSSSATLSLTINAKGLITAASTNAITQVGGSNGVDFNDNVKARFGTGNDLEIFHDGSHSYIDDTGTGNLYIQSNHVNIDSKNGEQFINCIQDGAVELYYDNTKTFETTPLGIKVPDSKRLSAGDGEDLKIYHNGSTNNFIAVTGGQVLTTNSDSLVFKNASNNETYATFTQNGAVELYHNNSKKFETYTNGTKLYGHLIGLDAGKYVQWQGANSNAFAIGMTSGSDNPTGSDNHLQFHHWNNSSWDKVFYVHRDFINIPDNKKIGFGDSNDLQIYHASNIDKIESNGAGLHIRQINNGDVHIHAGANSSASNNRLVARSAGAAELYHNGNLRLETRTNDVKFHGSLVAIDNAQIQLGNSGDVKIYHDGTNSYLDNVITGILRIRGNSAGQVEIQPKGGQYGVNLIPNGSVEIYHSGNKKFETTSAGVQVTGALNVTTTMHIPDGSIGLQIGSSNDLKIYHNGNGSYISEQGTGELILKSNSISFTNAAENEHLARFFQDSGVELYNNGTKKFATGSSGVYHNNNGTLSQNGIHFERGQNSNDFSTIFGVTNYPDASGYGDQNDGYWGKIQSKGGCVIILNTDGGRNDGRNNYDHFSIYHRANDSTNGKRAFSVDHVGGVQFGQAGINIDREWENQPSFSMTRDCNDGTNNTDNSAYFRFHGTARTHSSWTGGGNGSDFSANMLLDGGNYNASDRRAKTDIVDCPYGLDVVNKLKPRKYQLINSQLEKQGDDNINLGFIAQEIMEHIPECVNYLGDKANTPNEKGFARAYALDTNEVVAVLTKAIQELSAKVTMLESKV